MNPLRKTSWRVGAVIAVLVGVLALGQSVAMPRAEAMTAKAVHMNICGASCHNAETTKFRFYDGWTYLRDTVNNIGSGIWLITANEVCADDFLYMVQAFPNYEAHWFKTKNTEDHCGGLDYGNAMFTVGSNNGSQWFYKFPIGTYNTGYSPEEWRRVGCQKKNGWGFTWTACVVHIASSSVADSGEQASHTRFVTD